MASTTATLKTGSRFEDRYEILGELGAGSFGRVYKARQLSTGQSVAIKVLAPREGAEASTAREVERFRRETQICAALSHAFIVQLIDSGETRDGRLYAVFAHVPGETLEQVLQRDGALGARESVRLMIQVLEALAFAHGKGIVHRDLKPANLILTGSPPRRTAVVLDFGLGGLAEDRQREEWQRLTQTREFLGTPLYASPEQLAGERAGERSDLYSWGLVFLECLTGRHPFAEKGAAARLLAGGGEVELPGWLADHRLGELLATVTVADPRMRDTTAEALIKTLEEIAGGELPAAPERLPGVGRRTEKRRRSRPGSERRLAAIVSADVAGYSRLMADDEDATVRTVQTYREEIELHVRQHRGRIQFTGDNFLAEFPSAVEAVRCVLEVQRVLHARNADLAPHRRMEFRMGGHLGDVRVEGERLFGTGVNIAARLEGLAEPGGLCISETVREQLRGRLDLELEDLGERRVKNIPEPVHCYRVKPGASSAVATASSTSQPSGRARATLAVVTLLFAALAVGSWLLWNAPGRPEQETVPSSQAGFWSRPAIAVLPFDNLSGDPEQDYFVAGLVEDLITRLSSWRGFPVIARNSSFVYEDQAVDVRQVSGELGARYVVEGTVRKSGDRVRISTQLIDATTGHQVWAEQYEREIDEMFALQDAISRAIAGSMQPEVLKFESERAVRQDPESLDAWELAQRGWWHYNRYTKEDNVKARSFYDRAIQLDPHLAWAFAGLAMTHYHDAVYGWTDSPARSISELVRAAERGVELDHDDPYAQLALSQAYQLTGQREREIAAIDFALELNPSLAMAYYFRAVALTLTGRPDEAITSLEQAMRLSPHDPWMGAFYAVMGLAHFGAERYEKAVECATRSLQRTPDWPMAYSVLSASYGQLGQTDEARSALRARLKQTPGYSIASVRKLTTGADPDFVERYVEGLRRAGLE